jgi:hypothetical protein
MAKALAAFAMEAMESDESRMEYCEWTCRWQKDIKP